MSSRKRALFRSASGAVCCSLRRFGMAAPLAERTSKRSVGGRDEHDDVSSSTNPSKTHLPSSTSQPPILDRSWTPVRGIVFAQGPHEQAHIVIQKHKTSRTSEADTPPSQHAVVGYMRPPRVKWQEVGRPAPSNGCVMAGYNSLPVVRSASGTQSRRLTTSRRTASQPATCMADPQIQEPSCASTSEPAAFTGPETDAVKKGLVSSTNSEPTSSNELQNTSTSGLDSESKGDDDNSNTTLNPTQTAMDSSPPITSPGSEPANVTEAVNNIDGEESLAEDAENIETTEEHVPLSFQIPHEILRARMQVSPNVADRFWSQKLYRGPNGELISIHYCKNMEVAERVAKYFLEEEVIGFDVEWKPFARADSIKENASLIQIASENRIALFHISLFKGTTVNELLPSTLKTIIESQSIWKVGVAIRADLTRLRKYLDVQPLGVFELSRLHNLVENFTTNSHKAKSRRLVRLAMQVEQHLQLPLSKGDVRQSDWSLPLDRLQIEYAASDAYAGFRIFDVLEYKRKLLQPIPPRPLLCDFDPIITPREKKAPKTSSEKAVVSEEAAAADEIAEEEVDEDDEFDTAAEDFSGNETSDNYSESSAESSDYNEDSDAEYIPKTRRTGEVADLPGRPSITDTKSHSTTRRVGRVSLAAITASDPVYPKLPSLPDEDADSDSSDAFDPPVNRSSRATPEVSKDVESDVQVKSDSVVVGDLEGLVSSLDLGDVADEKSNFVPELTSISEPKTREPKVNQTSRSDNEEAPPKQESTQSPKADLTSAPKPVFAPLALTPNNITTSKSPECIRAEEWAQAYLLDTIPSPSSKATSRVRATIPHLRAYHLWHHQDLPLDEIAKHLRDPPLAASTVCGYIVSAITMEKLEYKDDDIREVLRGLPLGLRMTRWKWLCDRIGGV